MTREEEIKQAAKNRADQYEHPVDWNNCYHHYIQGAEWADQHPREGLWDSEKVIEWIKNNAGSYLEDNHKFGEGSEYCTTELLEDLRKAMEDQTMTDKELIKQEIESYKESMKGLEPHSDFRRGQITAYNQIMQFIDSLPEEHNEDLEEELNRWQIYHDYPEEYLDLLNFARHFAEWQKQQMKETLQTEYEKGRFDMREEMMKDVVSAEIKVSAAECYGKEDNTWIESRFLTPSEAYGFVPNEKIKIVIIGKEKLIKTEQQ